MVCILLLGHLGLLLSLLALGLLSLLGIRRTLGLLVVLSLLPDLLLGRRRLSLLSFLASFVTCLLFRIPLFLSFTSLFGLLSLQCLSGSLFLFLDFLLKTLLGKLLRVHGNLGVDDLVNWLSLLDLPQTSLLELFFEFKSLWVWPLNVRCFLRQLFESNKELLVVALREFGLNALPDALTARSFWLVQSEEGYLDHLLVGMSQFLLVFAHCSEKFCSQHYR